MRAFFAIGMRGTSPTYAGPFISEADATTWALTQGFDSFEVLR